MTSVCIATYNGEQYIDQQLKSILLQLAPEDEVIISDDGSTDATIERIAALADARVRVMQHRRRGATQNFFAALNEAKGDYIFLADQDDVWLPGKVARCKKLLQEYDLVVSDARITDASLQVIAPSLFQWIGSGEGLFKNWLTCTFYGSAMSFRRSVLEAAKPFPKAAYVAHDWWIGMVAEMTAKVLFLPEPLLLYRRHDATVTQLSEGNLLTRSARPLHVKLAARCQMAWLLIKYRWTH